jgi:glycosyltransferase involved in cell wall biosynthesis
MGRLALLVPARNAESVISRLLESAQQGGGFDEILVYDDASSDGTGDVARRFGARVLRSEENTGPSAGKNQLALHSTCDWVHFHDADDALAPGFVDCARRWMAEPGCDAVLFTTEDRDDATGAVLGRRSWDDAALRTDPTRYHIVNTVTNCGIYRRTAFLAAGGFDVDPATKYNEDQAMHIRMALAGLRFRAESAVGVIIYRRANSMSSGHPIECARAHVDVLSRVAAATGSRYRTEIGTRLWRLAGVCAGYQDWTYVDRSLRLAGQIGYLRPHDEHWAVRAMAAVDPARAVRVREFLIRLLKPSLRAGMPIATASSGREAR